MAFSKITICLLIAFHVASVLSQSDPPCTTTTQKAGFCVAIERCRNINAIVRSPTTPARSIVNYMKRINCTLPGVEWSICCQPTEIVNRRPLLPEVCGETTIPKVSEGIKTMPFQYPWMVVLQYTKNGAQRDGCGGSLISNRYVLTAAHCLKPWDGAKLYRVRLGEHDRSKPNDCIVYTSNETVCADPPVDVAIESTIVHGQYNASTLLHDLALIRMAQQVRFSDSIQPICLPVRQDVRNIELARYIVTGWGMTEKQTPSDVLMRAKLDHVPIPECRETIVKRGRLRGLSEKYQMCAGGKDHVATCEGDSGGPLGFTVRNVVGRFVQFGIVSTGANNCGEKSIPGIYTRVSSHMDWVINNMHP